MQGAGINQRSHYICIKIHAENIQQVIVPLIERELIDKYSRQR
jgi:hypothetical protein